MISPGCSPPRGYGPTLGLLRKGRAAETAPVETDSAWPRLAEAIAQATPPVTVLPVDSGTGHQVLARLGVSERSTLGALAANTGGLLVDHGWLRVLGGGTAGLPDIATASGVGAGTPGHLVIGYDVLGGRFALDGGGLGIEPGEVCYWGPDSLCWAGLGSGHSDFVAGVLGGNLAGFYAALRWDGWEQEIATVRLDQGLSVYPPPFTREGHDLAAASRTPIAFAELLAFYDDMARQVAGAGNGQQVDLRVTGADEN